MTDAALAMSPSSASASAPLLAVHALEAWYGESHVLHGIDFDVRPGEVVTLLGRNGAGKTTTLKAIMGILAKRKGSVTFEGRELMHLPARYIAREGIAFCPEERGIFASLSVEENLLLPPQVKPGGLSLERIFELSGGIDRARRNDHDLDLFTENFVVDGRGRAVADERMLE